MRAARPTLRPSPQGLSFVFAVLSLVTIAPPASAADPAVPEATASASASTATAPSPRVYKITVDMSLNGKAKTHRQLIAPEGEPTKVSVVKDGVGGDFVEVTATEGKVQGRKGILMAMTIGTIDAKNEWKIVSKPQLLALENKPLKMTESDSVTKKQSLWLSVVVKREKAKPKL